MPEEERADIKKMESMEEMPAVGLPQDVLLSIIERQRVSDGLKHILKGEMWDFEKERWMKSGDELMNDKGVRWCMTTVSSYLSIDKIVTSLENDEVRMMAAAICDDLIDKFSMCWDEFSIKKSDLFLVLDILDDFVFVNLTASRNATTINFMKPTYRRLETYKPEDRKGGAFSWIPFFGKD